ncbi:MAG: UDP-N-acetyl-D-mannosamine dehydrogenase [Novosphingobium sp.]|nr:UDP-N-acetyl-D-mannosamine dehydrogenase [Novosphingobium sp.]
MITRQQTVAVIGLGYIGLPTATLLASSGFTVSGVDINPAVVETINAGKVHIEEKDLDGLLHKVLTGGTFRAFTEVPQADYFLIAVPTPLDADHKPNLDFVLSAARAIAPKLQKNNCVILESTSPVGTTEKVARLIRDLRPDLCVPVSGNDQEADIAVTYCPERVLPGKIIRELVSNDRVIGGMTPACAKVAAQFYRLFVKGECLETSARTAEMVKLAENSFRDVNIAFANELSLVADTLEIDIWEVLRLANRHPRVSILKPGPGVGGHCIAVDPWFLVAGAPEAARLVRTAREVNTHKSRHVFERLDNLLCTMPDRKMAVLGLAFKPDIDDFRESPALEIASDLARLHGVRMMMVEPFADTLPEPLAGSGATLCDLEEAVREAEIIAILVDHTAFGGLTRQMLSGKIVYDSRGMLSK